MSTSPETQRELTAGQFRLACAEFATGIAIAATLDDAGQPHGMTVNSFTSVSMEPPLILICVDIVAGLLPIFTKASAFGLSFLAEQQQDLSSRFARRGQDRFESTPWEAGQTGVPLIPGALAHLECRIDQTIQAGDHAILISRVIAADISSGRPLLYFERGYRKLE
ncbi:MAG: flavin reductase family protein [Bryobacterales bacterium]|nr:flavin reductase family protein [Bryobacterales bacterium]